MASIAKQGTSLWLTKAGAGPRLQRSTTNVPFGSQKKSSHKGDGKNYVMVVVVVVVVVIIIIIIVIIIIVIIIIVIIIYYYLLLFIIIYYFYYD